ncbi:MAG: hypothetical protein ACK5L3_03210 [Oscillospiraceae bacterium]
MVFAIITVVCVVAAIGFIFFSTGEEGAEGHSEAAVNSEYEDSGHEAA